MDEHCATGLHLLSTRHFVSGGWVNGFGVIQYAATAYEVTLSDLVR